jgi:hypothetical protein
MRHLGDEELLRQTAVAHSRAHLAPKSIDNPSDAWARFSREWMELAREVDRRGLKQPDVGHL